MALVIVSGLACSGRTTRSCELLDDFATRIGSNSSYGGGGGKAQSSEEGPVSTTTTTSSSSTLTAPTPKLRLVHLTNADANIERNAFATQLSEKPARAAYLSLVMRHVAHDAIIIADGGAGTNIKGFRYQLYCAAREIGVRCLSILCVARPEVCKARNTQRRVHQHKTGGESHAQGTEGPYEDGVLDELLMRFEEPNPMTRWDSPLFVLDCNPGKEDTEGGKSGEAALHIWEPAPFDAIWSAATTGRVTKAPDVVAPSRGTSSNYLSLLESTTQLVLSALQTLAASGSLPDMGGEVQLPLPLPPQGHAPQSSASRGAHSTVQVPLNLPAGKGSPSTATLQRLRRQFVKMHASGAAAQNEIGLVMGDEGGRASRRSRRDGGNVAGTLSAATSRAERKVQQAQQQKQLDTAASHSAGSHEEVIARRFAAYLEESL